MDLFVAQVIITTASLITVNLHAAVTLPAVLLWLLSYRYILPGVSAVYTTL